MAVARQPRYQPIFLAPDLDQNWTSNPGVLTGVVNLVPNKRGNYINWACNSSQAFESGLSYASATYGTPLTGYVFKKVVSGGRMFICSATKIVELTAPGTVTDRSSGGGSYTTAAQWTMTAQGDAILAASLANSMQVSTSGAFSALGGGSPKAACIASNVNFVMAANYNDGSNAYSDGWWCSALGNYASWTASLTTQAANGRLLDTPGPIKALVPLRDAFIAYKDDSIYLGDYVGDTTNGIIFQWKLMSDRIGCSSPHGVAVLNDTHYFVHRTGIYAFDGATVTNIGQQVNNWLIGTSGAWFTDLTQLSKIQTVVDELQQNVIFLASTSTGASNSDLNAGPAYNLISQKWGLAGGGQNGTFHATTNGRCYAVMHATLGDLLAWDSTLTSSFDTTQILIGSDDGGTTIKLRRPQYGVTISASGDGSSITPGYLGNGAQSVDLIGIKPRFYTWSQFSAPTSNTATAYKDESQNNQTASVTPTWNSTDLRFDCKLNGQYVVPGALSLPGALEVAGLGFDVGAGGYE